DSSDGDWVRRHLAALAGLGGDESMTGPDRRDEAFAAWRRFLEGLAERRPLVLLFEDLHWADDGLLDFVDHLVEWASGVPILVDRGEQDDLPLPESIQGIVGARLDALPPLEKQLLQDAAVIGKVFWPGAVAALGDSDPAALEEQVHALERKQFVRRDRRSS